MRAGKVEQRNVLDALRSLTVDGRLLFVTRFVRLFAYGALSVVLVLYLVGLGLTESATGVLLTATLLGDTLVSLFLTTRADRLGRRRMLVAGAVLMAAAGITFAFTRQFWLLLVAGTVGVISPSGNEVGPFLPIEQAALSQVVSARARTDIFAWYTLAGSLATALGALAAGLLTDALQHSRAPVDSLAGCRFQMQRHGVHHKGNVRRIRRAEIQYHQRSVAAQRQHTHFQDLALQPQMRAFRGSEHGEYQPAHHGQSQSQEDPKTFAHREYTTSIHSGQSPSRRPYACSVGT